MKLMKQLLFIGLLLYSPLLTFAKQCPNFVPGIERMARGVDITSLDLFPSDLLLSNGFRHSLFNFSCQTGMVWSHPTTPMLHYRLPDQIAAINTVPGGALNMVTSFFEDMETYNWHLKFQLGWDLTLKELINFSAGIGYQQTQKQILKSNKSVALTAAYVSAVQIDFKSSDVMPLNQNFVNYITKILPTKYEDNIEVYKEFLNTFGTHYFESAMFGGYLVQKTILNNDYVLSTSMKEITGHLKASFKLADEIGFGGDHGLTVNWNSSYAKFHSNSDMSMYYYGGQTDLSNTKVRDFLNKWINSVNKDPWLFGGQVKPIAKLIKNETIRMEVQKAVRFKMTEQYLQELKNALYLTGIKLSSSEKRNLTAFEEFINDPSSGEFEIEDIRSTIDELFLQVERLRDRAYLVDLSSKLRAMYDEILWCKHYIFVRYCSQTNLVHEVPRQIQEYRSIIDKIYRIINYNESSDHKEMHDLIRDGSTLLQYQRTVVVDACENNNECLNCLQSEVDYLNRNYPKCRNLNLWRVLKCKPNQFRCR